MRVFVVRPPELTAGDIDRWRLIQDADPDLASPYFCPEFTLAVGAVREDVFVAVLEEDGDVAGYFPFQRRRFGFGKPVGGDLSDFQAVIVRPGTAWNPATLLRACGLVSWDFHHLVAAQAPLARYHDAVGDSHYLDVRGGFDGYAAGLRQAGSGQPKRITQMKRRMEREFQRVEFVPHVEDLSVLDTLIRWKSQQYLETGLPDVFEHRWAAELLRRIHGMQGERFAGMLSALLLDGELAAVHLGMRSRTVWHWWFPRHDQKFSQYSPGIQLLAAAADHAPRIGVRRIDLGLDDEGTTYKVRLRSGGIPVARGRIEVASPATTALRWREATEAWVRRSPLIAFARLPGRVIRRFERWYQLR